MARFKNTNWDLNAVGNGKIETWQQAEIAVLMDIRDELQALNKTLSCYRVVEMADAVRRLDKRAQVAGHLLKRKSRT